VQGSKGGLTATGGGGGRDAALTIGRNALHGDTENGGPLLLRKRGTNGVAATANNCS
jgi:hypothetical protein